MKKNYRYIAIFTFLFIITLTIIPAVVAKPRKTFLTNYIVVNRIKDKGFSNTIKENESVSFEATAYALDILSYYNLFEYPEWFETKANVNVSIIDGKLIKKLNNELDDDVVDLYKIYYLLSSIKSLNISVKDNVNEDKIEDYLKTLKKNDGGFSTTNTTILPSIISTYFAVKIYKLIDSKVDDKDDHIDWINDCRNSDGGYGGNSTLSSGIYNTYCAVLAIKELGDLDDDLSKEDDTVEYLNDFYVGDEGDVRNYGGFLPDKDAKNALLSSTYYCVKVLSLLDPDELESESIANWVLERQNFVDGGFADTTDGAGEKISSVSTSYYAFQILKIFDESLLNLEEEIFMADFDWIVLIVLLSILGLAVVGIVIIWKKRKI